MSLSGRELGMQFYRRVIYILMHWIGLIGLLRFLRRREIAILMIHGVTVDQDGFTWKPLRPQLSCSKLEEYLKILSKRYRFISLIDAVEMLQGKKPLQPYSMVLTFDDGYRNNLTHALPILRRFNAPATFFLPTGFINKPRPFWFDRLDYVIQHTHENDNEVNIGSFRMRLDNSSREKLSKSYEKFRRVAKEQHMSDIEFVRQMEQLAARLEKKTGRALSDIHEVDNNSAVMTWEQIKESSDDDVSIGSHTVDHIRLDLVDTETARDQLVRSKRDIETHIVKPCLCLAYPNGDYSEQMIKIAKECGYHCCVTTDEGINRQGDDVFKLRRINLPGSLCSYELLAIVCDLSGFLSRNKAFLLGRSIVSDNRRDKAGIP